MRARSGLVPAGSVSGGDGRRAGCSRHRIAPDRERQRNAAPVARCGWQRIAPDKQRLRNATPVRSIRSAAAGRSGAARAADYAMLASSF